MTGTKVRVKYGRGKTQKIYEAHIKKTDVDNGEQFYLVHYFGWNVRSVKGSEFICFPDSLGSGSVNSGVICRSNLALSDPQV